MKTLAQSIADASDALGEAHDAELLAEDILKKAEAALVSARKSSALALSRLRRLRNKQTVTP